MTELTILFFVCFIQAAKYGAANLLPPAPLRALITNGGVRENKEVFAPLLFEMEETIFKDGLLRIISDYAVERVAVLLAFARASEID